MASVTFRGLQGYEDQNLGTVALAGREKALPNTLTAPASAMLGGAGSLSVFPPSCASAVYPSPFAERHVAAVSDLMKRTASEEQVGLYTGPSDLIGRFYTPTAYGLSMKKLIQMTGAKDPSASAVAVAPPATGAKVVGKGPALKKTAAAGGGGAPAGLLLALLGEEGSAPAGGAATAYPKPQKVMAVKGTSSRSAPVDRRQGGVGEAVLFGGVQEGWTPLTEAQVDASSREEEIAARYDMPAPVLASLQQASVGAYWAAVEGVCGDHELAAHRRDWEDGILSRLAASTAVSSAAGGQGRRWVDPTLIVPFHIGEAYGRAYFMPPPPSLTPGDAVEAMFVEVAGAYAHAVKRAIVDYALRSPKAQAHMGLDLHILDSTRYTTPPSTTRGECDVTFTAVPLTRLALSRSLYKTEAVQAKLLELWNGPRAMHGVDASPYASTPLTGFTTLQFAHVLPASVKEFTQAVQGGLENALAVLKGQWHKEAGEILASFVLEMDAQAKGIQAKAEEEEKRKAMRVGVGEGPKRHGKDAGDGIQAASLDPLFRDFARAVTALFLARQYSAGECVGQEYALLADEAANAIIRKGDADGPAPPLGIHQPGYLPREEDIDVHAGGMAGDALVATLARTGMGLKPAGSAGERGVAGEEKKDDAEHGRFPPGVDVVLKTTNAAMSTQPSHEEGGVLASLHVKKVARRDMDPFVARLIGLTASHLAAMPLLQLRHLVAHAHAKLESRDAVHTRRLRAAFASAAVSMSNCLRDVVYTALKDYKLFLARYMPTSKGSGGEEGLSVGEGGGAGLQGSVVETESKVDASGSLLERKSGDGEDDLQLGLHPTHDSLADPHIPASPALRINLALQFGAGGPMEDEEEGHGGRGVGEAGHAKEKPKKEAKKADGEKKELTPEQVAAVQALNDSAADVPVPHDFAPAADLKRLWAGSAAVALEPGWPAVGSSLHACLEAIVTSCSTMPRLESAMANATSALSMGKPGAGASTSGAAMSTRDLLGAVNATKCIASVSGEDELVLDLRTLIDAVEEANAPAAEAVRAQFDRFLYLFAPAERKRLVALASDPLNSLDTYRAELAKLDAVAQDVATTTEDAVECGLVRIVTTGVKDAFRSRVRALQTCMVRHVKASALHRCEMSNAEYARLLMKLKFRPSNSEQLVALTEFSQQLDRELSHLSHLFVMKNGIAEGFRTVLLDGLAREWTFTQAMAMHALGPAVQPGDRSVAPSAAHSRAQSAANERPVSRPVTASAGSVSGHHVHAPALNDTEGLGFTNGQIKLLKETLAWPDRIASEYATCSEMLAGQKSALVDALSARVASFDAERTEIRAGLDKLIEMGELKGAVNTAKEVVSYGVRLEACLAETDAINRQQTLLELTVVAYEPELRELQARHAPFERMWQTVSQFAGCIKRWYAAPLSSNNADEATKEAEGLKVTAAKCLREIPEEAAGPKALLQRVKDDTEKFLGSDIQLLALLANPGLKDRHWTAMEQAVGFSIPHGPKTSLGDMLERKLETKISSIEEFCVTASKEYSLEKASDRMEGEWAPVTLDLKAYKTTGTHILGGGSSDIVQALLDDHIVKSSTMAASRYAKALEGRIKGWVNALTEIQSVLDVWLKVQSTWLYLEPIFGSEDIMKQMPLEGQRFKLVDETWRGLVKGAVIDPVAQRALRQPGQLAALTECHTLLEQIQKGLNAYLESKRLIFPRFFFLSNDELLEILAETKDPQRVQPHLPKCFEGVNGLDFEPGTGNIIAMMSVEGERVPFPPVNGKYINPADTKGAVEMWLLAAEDAMKRACAQSVDEAMVAYPKAASRSQWAAEWPGQAVLAVTCTYWTYEIEQAIASAGSKGLAVYGKKCTSQIEDIIMKVRGKLTALARKTLGALVVLDVHARDVTVQMAENGVETCQDFEWNSQLRLYWAEGGESARTGKPGSVTMKMINAVLQYAYEYLGNSTRLVVTPLTDRCYRTLMGAIHLGLGGAPEGPAGTGKTETTKDLAKAVAIQCVVFNCSDGLDYIAMGKFFKGLASSGAWACFDEFNRIELEVLSVVAQQVLTIQRAIRERKERFVFEGTELSLRWTASAFITMNPGYAGRSELPDNLKALFRSVAMMVPDYGMISEIMLYSYGYLDARPMSKKIVATYKLCSEQLSSQDHYDYGMRAVMAVLRAAGNLKRSDGDLPEGVLVLRAIVDVNLPKFLAPDVPLFHAIVRDLFPGVVVPPPDRTRLTKAMQEAAHDLGVRLLPVVIEKVLQIYEMMIVRHGFMLVGLPWAGKTTAAKILQLAMSSLHEQYPEEPMYTEMIYVTLNPKSITMGQLYGQFDDLTHEWTDGVLATKFRDCAQNKIGTPPDRKWVLFDGPVDAVWIENMNTVLDDNKKLCLTSGEIIQMSGVMSMVFEVGDLAAASPATVSRCGMIYMEPASLGWKPLVSSWLEAVAEDNPRYFFHPAHPSNKAAKERAEKEETAYFEAQEAAVQEEQEAKAKGAHAKKKRARASDLNPNDPRIFTLDEAQRAQIEGLCDWLVEPCLVLLRRHPLVEYCPSQDTSLVSTLLAVLQASLNQLVRGATGEGAPGYDLGSLHLKGKAEPNYADIEALFMFALVWSVGATCNEDGRAVLSSFVWSAVKDASFLVNHPLATYFRIRGWRAPGEAVPEDYVAVNPPSTSLPNPYDVAEPKLKMELPEKGVVHDHWYSPVEGRWREWASALPKADIGPTAQYSDIIVPTVATAQFDYLVHLYITAGSSVLVCGPTGVGKSAYMKRMLLKALPRELWVPIFLAFSARTTAKATQAIMEQKLERRRKGVYGPPSGTRCVVFVDDLNMPEVEKYGAQPPIELLRQFADQGGWYDLAENAFKAIEDAFMVSAMGPPGGGRSNVTPRLLRHFNLLCFTDFNDDTLKGIFSTVMTWYMGKNPNYAADVVSKGTAVVNATLDVYKTASKGLRPTPAKSHYTFNLRDFSRVVEGLFMVSPETSPTAAHIARAWTHEVARVFYDRLTVDDDREWLLSQVKDITKKHFGTDFDELFQPLIPMHPNKAPAGPPLVAGGKPAVTIEHFRMLMWGDYMPGPGASNRGYGEVNSLSTMAEKLEMFMVEYNAQAKKPLDLVMFLFFLEHVSRVARVLKMPGGHALLVGVGGSGRRCAATLASYINECVPFGIELSKSYGVTEWKDDLKRILKAAGTGAQPAAFVFVDTQIKWDGMLEDINAILNSGEVPGLFAPDERADICEKMGGFARAAGMGKDASAPELYALFVDRCKRNLHILLCMSPIGDAFRDRLRKFPSLVNCCTIDWFKSWPEDALTAVAHKALKPLNLDTGTADLVVDICQYFHQSALHTSEAYLSQARRFNYVTPTSYLELLSAFRRALELKRGEVSAARNRYVVGLEKLEFATQAVNIMQTELTALGPTLEKAQVDTAELMKVIEARLPGVEATRSVVGKEAAVANEEAAKVGVVKADCEADLAVAIPVLEGALSSLDTITPADINNIKVLANPPANVKLALSAVCVMLGEKPEKVTVEGKKVDDYWGTSRKMMNDSAFIGRLKGFDLNNIDPKKIKVIRDVYLTNENFKPEIIKSASSAAEGMCKWVCAMDQYEKVAKVVEPKKQALAAAEAALSIMMTALAVKQGELKAVEDELGTLMTQLDGAKKYQEKLIFEVQLCQKKLVRASQLIGGLGGEKMRWTDSANRLQTAYNNLTGDVLLAAGVLAYLGAFTMEYRRRAVDGWLVRCMEKKIPCSVKPRSSGDDEEEEEAEVEAPSDDGEAAAALAAPTQFSLATVLGDPIAVRQWQIEGLPTDSFSTDNGIIVTQARRWALMIDPQGQANKWIRTKEKSKGLIVTKQTDPGFLRTLENAIQFGRPVLLENVGEELDPALEPVLLKVVFKQGGVDVIRLGDSTVEYDDRFKLYLTTKLRNPHYLPETSTKVTLVNFMITPDGLADQLLGTVSAQERPDLEEEKNRLILQSADNNRTLKELEDKILHVLSSSEGNILEDESAINILNSSKELSNDIAAKQVIAAKTEAEIDATRAGYTPVAQHASRLFFCISDLGAVDPMYQYSMAWFTRLFVGSIQGSKKSDDLKARIESLNSHFTYSIYRNVCRSLFEKDKLLFAFLLCISIMGGKGEVDGAEWFFLLTGGTPADNPHPNPAPGWMSDKVWGEFVRLSALPAFEGLYPDVAANATSWKRLYDHDAPHKQDLPGKWGSMGYLTRMQKLCVLRCIRPDKLVLAVQEFVGANLGPKFLAPPPFDLKGCYEDSTTGTPLVFVLSAGSDPMAALLYFAEGMKAGVHAISLGQGQGPIAEAMIDRMRVEGGWVVLQNCHLAVSWMPMLERIVEQLALAEAAGLAKKAAGGAGGGAPVNDDGLLPPPHPNFRLWLTSYPSAAFPVSILQNGVKMTNEPPKGIRLNMKRTFLSDPVSDAGFFNGVANADLFRRMLFGLAFFHASLQERRAFGPLGFNIPYEFNDSDLRISAMQLAMFLDDAGYAAREKGPAAAIAAVPFKHLQYLTGECNYGGRVTDGSDRITLTSILSSVYCPEIFDASHPLCSSPQTAKDGWVMPPPEVKEYKAYLEYIENTLPAMASPEVFGLHENANIAKDQAEVSRLFDSAVTAQAAGGGMAGGGGGSKGGVVKTKDETIGEIAADILARLRPEFDLEAVGAQYPNDPRQSMNTVLIQELARYNRLLAIVRSTMASVQKAMKGLVVLSATLEGVANDCFMGRVPEAWKGRSFSSRKPLAAYFSEFLDRIRMLDNWIEHDAPPIFWISGFFFTQSFLTGAAQNYARKYTIPIDDVVFDPECMPESINKDSVKEPPADGVYVYGMSLDGCKWNYGKGVLDESEPKVLFSPGPSMLLRPCRPHEVRKFQAYSCPLYKTSDRRGVLATTGHSSNFVMRVPIPSDKDPHHWIRRGVCMLLSLDN